MAEFRGADPHRHAVQDGKPATGSGPRTSSPERFQDGGWIVLKTATPLMSRWCDLPGHRELRALQEKGFLYPEAEAPHH